MNKVYVVMAGEYSGRHVVGVFSARELADEYVAKHNASDTIDKADVDEYELDFEKPTRIVEAWESTIRLGSGSIDYRKKRKMLFGPNSQILSDEYLQYTRHCYTSAYSEISQEHADKLAIEKRQKWLRENSHAV